MKISPSYRSVILKILSGTYSQSDVREFVHLCYLLALPLIRRRIAQGRIDLASLGLQQTDVV
ncbi:MAG TPA: hypothetical protein VMH23_06140, partial [Bacteroidota bacterium]|nr:hypothetical protein [Bacteroidota bacterium]